MQRAGVWSAVSNWRRGTASSAWIAGVAMAALVAGCGDPSLVPKLPTPNPRPPVSNPPPTPPPTPGQSGSVTISPQFAALAPGQSFKFTATVTGSGQVEWLVNGTAGGSSAAGTVDSSGNYTAPGSVSQSENVLVTAALTGSPQQNYASAVVSIIQAGQVDCPNATGNPQVALYQIYLPAPGQVSIQFGTGTAYGLTTWQVATPTANGGGVQIYVAGMLAQTLYHMRAQVALNNGATFNDADQTCTTGSPPLTSTMNVSTPGAGTPQPGIELWNTIVPNSDTQAWATDLSGNVIWTYSYTHTSADLIQGVQLMPDGNMLMLISYLSSMTATQSAGIYNEIREVDLAGNTVRSITMDQLNQSLATSNLRDAQGNLYQLKSFHHSVLPLPNGHWVLLADYWKNYSNLTGLSGTRTVIGDALVDVDQNSKPDWVWSAFDHLDVNRHPMNFPDWTHSNDMLYSSDDHNLLLSIRHQNWIIKINFLDGAGSGAVMWRLGEGGDFKLVGATDPTDWFYAQHGMSYFTPNTTGVFRLGLMDNGNDRILPSGQVFCQPPMPSQCYSTMPLLEINEGNMTATMITHYKPPPSYYSPFGGNVDLLANNDIHVNFCAPSSGATVQELDPQTLKPVWQSTTPGAYQFRVSRLGSMYPGVQW
jgi:hypothetical protein